jgi:serine protease DegS
MKAIRFFAWPIVAGILVGLSVLWWYEAGPGATSARLAGPFGGRIDSYADAVQKAAPAVVNIYTTQVVEHGEFSSDPLFDRFVERPRRERLLSSLGSGVLVSDKGYILTSNHVIQGGDEIIASLADGREAVANVVGTDPETDLALLQIDLDDLPVVRLANAGPVRVGDVALAIGNPLGVGSSVSMGIVSATGRSHLGIATFENFIQTDAAISRGNSGGALIDTRGNLIGINTAILSSDGTWQGIGFATPASVAQEVMSDLIVHGRVIRGWLGVTVQDITPNLASTFGLEEVRGGLVSEVLRVSPAFTGGLRPGDVLVGVNGDNIRDGYEAMNIIAGTKPGSTLELNVIRNHENIDITVEIGTRPPASNNDR